MTNDHSTVYLRLVYKRIKGVTLVFETVESWTSCLALKLLSPVTTDQENFFLYQ